MCINLFQFYKRIHLTEFLQALKISLLLYVLASKAPVWAAMAVSEHTQDLSLWKALIHFPLVWHHSWSGSCWETEPCNLKWLKSKKYKASLIIIISGWNNLYVLKSQSIQVFIWNPTELQFLYFLIWNTIILIPLYLHWNVS